MRLGSDGLKYVREAELKDDASNTMENVALDDIHLTVLLSSVCKMRRHFVELP